MGTRQTLIEKIKINLKADQVPEDLALGEADYDALIEAALARYSKDRPERAFTDYPGDGATFDFDLPADWDDALSTVLAVEYPQGKRPERRLDQHQHTIYAAGTASEKLRLLGLTPQSGETVRLFYTRPHTATDSSSSVPASDEAALAWYAAAEGSDILAQRYAQTSEPLLSADTVNYGGKSGEYTRLARELRKKYYAHLGMKEGDAAPASGATLDWDPGLSKKQGDYLSHGGPGER